MKQPQPQVRFHLPELETFLVVVEEGSFSKAADRLCISQPSASSRIKRLEEVLRVKLLRRTTRSLELTEDGKLLKVAAEETLAGLYEVLKQFRDRSEAARNRVVVAVTPMIGATFMPWILQSYQERYPDVEVELRDVPYDQLLRIINDGGADLAVAGVDSDHDHLLFRCLAEEALVLMVPAKHPLSGMSQIPLSTILPFRINLLNRYSSLREHLAAEFHRLGTEFEAGTTGTMPTLLGLLDADSCITFLPRSVAKTNLRAGRVIVTVENFHHVRRYGTLTAPKVAQTPAVQSFREHLHREFGPLIERLDQNTD